MIPHLLSAFGSTFNCGYRYRCPPRCASVFSHPRTKSGLSHQAYPARSQQVWLPREPSRARDVRDADPVFQVVSYYCRLGSLPPPTESVIELNKREPFTELRLCKIELRREVVVLTYQHLEVTRSAVQVEYLREPVGISRRRRQ